MAGSHKLTLHSGDVNNAIQCSSVEECVEKAIALALFTSPCVQYCNLLWIARFSNVEPSVPTTTMGDFHDSAPGRRSRRFRLILEACSASHQVLKHPIVAF